MPSQTPQPRQVVIFPDVESSGYRVTVPSLPGCNTCGDTLDEALENARDAIACWLDAADQQGWPIPEETAGVHVATVTGRAAV